jgi:hypothetical protein
MNFTTAKSTLSPRILLRPMICEKLFNYSRTVQFTASYTLGWAFNQNDSTGDTGSSPTDSTLAISSIDPTTRCEIRIWPVRASPHKRAAIFVTVPIAP